MYAVIERGGDATVRMDIQIDRVKFFFRYKLAREKNGYRWVSAILVIILIN